MKMNGSASVVAGALVLGLVSVSTVAMDGDADTAGDSGWTQQERQERPTLPNLLWN